MNAPDARLVDPEVTQARKVCRSCGAKLTWCRTVNGVLMPLDDELVPDGNVLLEGTVGHVLSRGQANGARAAGRTLYRSHFASCAHSSAWRKR